MDFPERPKFREWRERLKRNSDYVALCRIAYDQGYGSKVVKDHLYEFCAMNGHLAAFEEVFEK